MWRKFAHMGENELKATLVDIDLTEHPMPKPHSSALPSIPRPPYTPNVTVVYCVPDEQTHLLPRRAPSALPGTVPVPRTGELVFLSSTSAWVVTAVVHDWRGPFDLVVQVWLHYSGGTPYAGRADFAPTQ